MNRIMSFIRARKKLVIAGGAIVLVILFMAIRSSGTPEYETTILAVQPELVKKVHVTGKVESAQGVDLAFEVSGKVGQVLVKTGDPVTEGQVLASLSNSDASAQVGQAQSSLESARSQLLNLQASLAIQQAKLDELRRGARPEEVAIAQAKVDNAYNSLQDAQSNLESVQTKADIDLSNLYSGSHGVVQDSLAKATSALVQQTDDFFFNDATQNPSLTFLVTDTQAKYLAETGRYPAGQALVRLQAISDTTAQSPGVIEANLVSALSDLVIIRDYLSQLQLAVNAAVGLDQTTLATYQTAMSAARTSSVAAANAVDQRVQSIQAQKALNATTIGTAQSQLTQAESTYTLAQSELTLKKAGATHEQLRIQQGYVDQAVAAVKSQEAQIRYAQSNLRGASATLSKTVLKSPVNGVVGKINIKTGEIVPALTGAATVISDSQYEIKANIAEVDIAHIKPGDHARVVLDAYGEESPFDAIVVSIDTAETVVSNVTTYVATLHFTHQDERVKAGMTAGVDIVADEKSDVLAVPQRAIVRNGSNQKVLRVIVRDGKKQTIQERLIITGLEGSDGMIEIVEGVDVGDEIIVAEK